MKEDKSIQKYYKQPYWIDSLNKRYEKDINKDIEILLEKLLIKWKKDYKINNDIDVCLPKDIKLFKKFLNDMKYLIDLKINCILKKIIKENKNLIAYSIKKDSYILNDNDILSLYEIDNEKTFNNFISFYIKNDDVSNHELEVLNINKKEEIE